MAPAERMAAMEGPTVEASISGFCETNGTVGTLASAATCPVCLGTATADFAMVDGRHYRDCGDCAAIYLHPSQRPGRDAEYHHYLSHNNDPADLRYRRFLSRLADPMLERLAPGSSGLDYGSGPGPALAIMLREAGHHVRLYDPFFSPDPAPLEGIYDFIVCSETIEHFHRPADAFARLGRMLKPGGWLGLMTQFFTGEGPFETWRYRRDPTHVVFYRPETFPAIARMHGWTCEIPALNVALMRSAPS
jgi:hypothetical protein